MIAKAWWFSILIGLVMITWLHFWSQQTTPLEVIHITTPHDAEFTVPVYAQFDVTQTVRLSEVTPLTTLQLPLRLPTEPTGELVVEVRQNNQLLQRWRIPLADYTSQAGQLIELSLDFMPIQYLKDAVDIHLAVPSLDAHFPDKAPRVVVENADQGYPDGNYRIAHNAKKGDIGLTVWSTQTNWTSFIRLIHDQPVIAVKRAMRYGLIFLLLLNLPQFLWQIWVRTTANTTEQSF